MEVQNKLCEGCCVFDECGIPFHSLEEEANKCPCNRCLVKPVCDIGVCEDYSKFMKSLRMH